MKILPLLAFLCLILVCTVMTIAPLGAMLADLFPPNVRYCGVSFPYNLAVGWLGGFLPPIAFTLVTANGNMFAGLWYPILITGVFGLVVAVAYREQRAT